MSHIEPVREPAPEPDAFLESFESLPYPVRMRELALRARALAGTPELRDLLAGLSARGRYERRVALHMAMAARDLPYVEAVLAGPDTALRRAALRAVRTLPVSDDAAAAVLDDAPAELRRAFYRMLRHCRRAALADRLLPEVRERWGDREAAALLPACTAGTAARLLPDLAHDVTAWRALAERHPGVFLDHARANVSQWWWWRRCKPGLPVLARRAPAELLELFERDEARRFAAFLPPRIMPALFRVDAVRAAGLAGRTRRRRTLFRQPAYRKGLARLPAADLRECLPDAPNRLRDVLVHVPPGRRAEVFDLVRERYAHPAGVWNLPLLGLLPPDRAAAEARRMLEWHRSVRHSARSRPDDPEIPLRLTSHLPYEEAAGPVREAAFGGDPRRRGLARTLLVELTARTGDAALLRSLVTELADRTRNEQDPLRGTFIESLASVPLRLLDDAFVPPLTVVAESAVSARDSSPATRRSLRDLADRMLRHASEPALARWALGVYAGLAARHGPEAFGDHRLDRVLPRGGERGLLDVLGPCLRDHEDVVPLARSLGRRAFALADLQERLRAAALDAPGPLAREAAALWLADPARRERRAVALLAADASAIVLPEVWRVVAGRRTDLLRTALDGVSREAPAGRFEDGARVPEVRPQDPGRWTPSQVEHGRAVLTGAARDGARPPDARIAALAGLGRLPGGLADLAPWAERGDETVLAEAALEAAAGAGRPAEALALLLVHARGPRSAVAVAGLGRCAARVPPAVLGPVLEETLTGPGGKVTARKEAARLLERLRPPDAADALLRAWDDPGLHRDVRVSVAAALRRMPGDPRAIPALDAAAGPYASEPMLRTLCQAKPSEYAPGHRPAYAALVRRLASAAGDPGIRFRAAKAFALWAPWYEDGFAEILAAVADPADPAGDDWLPVLRALVRAGSAGEEALDVLSSLLAADLDDRVRSRAVAIANMFAHLRPGQVNAPLARRVVRMLAAHPLYAAQAVEAALGSSRLKEGGVTADLVAEELAGLRDLIGDRPFLAARVAGRGLLDLLGGHGLRGVGGPARLLPAARMLVGRGDAVSHLLAVTVVRTAGAAAGWPDEWRGLLDELRRSEDVEVRQCAWDITPSP